MKKRKKLVNVRIFNETGTRRIETIEEARKLPRIIVVGEMEGKYICMKGVFKWNSFMEGFWNSEEQRYEIVSLAERERLRESNYDEIFLFRISEVLNEVTEVKSESWPEILATRLSDIKRSSVSRFFVSGHLEMSLTTGRSTEGHKMFFFNTHDIHEDGFEHGNNFFRVIEN